MIPQMWTLFDENRKSISDSLHKSLGLSLESSNMLVHIPSGKNFVIRAAWGNESYIVKCSFHAVNKLFYEKDSLVREAKALALLSEQKLPVPKVIHFDKLSSASLLVMDCMEGRNATEYAKSTCVFSESIDRELGALCKSIAQNESNDFSFFSSDTIRSSNAFAFVKGIIELLEFDAKRYYPELCPKVQEVADVTELMSWAFSDDIVPRLINQDIWYGNVLVSNGLISALIDFEECLFGDELMMYMFHGTGRLNSVDFMRGYGIGSLSEKDKGRICIYRLLQIVKLQLELGRKNELGVHSQWLEERYRNELRLLIKGDLG